MISFFKDEYKWASNFEPVVIYYKHYQFGSVEHAFHAAKELNPGVYFFKILAVPTHKAYLAKRIGKQMNLRKDWDKVKISIMEKFLRQKFEYEKFKNLLLSTGNEYMEEGNYWHDNFWGNCYCKKCKDKEGLNHLGKLLMKIREELNINRERINNRRHPRGICTTE